MYGIQEWILSAVVEAPVIFKYGDGYLNNVNTYYPHLLPAILVWTPGFNSVSTPTHPNNCQTSRISTLQGQHVGVWISLTFQDCERTKADMEYFRQANVRDKMEAGRRWRRNMLGAAAFQRYMDIMDKWIDEYKW